MNDGFYYDQRHAKTIASAEQVLEIIWSHIQPRSVIDVGCGVGTWGQVAKSFGATDVRGVDSHSVPKNERVLSPDEFFERDLTSPAALDGLNAELVICLEVVEHLPDAFSDQFVASLCNSADVVLFSAAIPGQGGHGHINEKWQDIWAGIFADHGYHAFDIVRPRVWGNPDLEIWYRQNTVVYSTVDGPLARAGLTPVSPDNLAQLRLVHPKMTLSQPTSIPESKLAMLTWRLGRKMQFVSQTGRWSLPDAPVAKEETW
ncbi:MAG: methyltransferase domain-containing protein [Rhodopirellula sp. JB044]|uniref:methyltransferase domain-containing protein n=1 Tax=Rhodopirellula sp. JB044 TaxID=3342844 RepID=UPI00370B87E9